MIEISEIKATLESKLQELKRSRYIDAQFCSALEDMCANQTLRIGVVGKMKAGKSSLINAAIFGGDVLPTGTLPVTVTLTEISYGDKEDASVELLNRQDIKDLQAKAAYSGSDEYRRSLADAASKTLKALPKDYEQYLDNPSFTTPLTELQKYTAAKGQYSGLAKSVKIHLPNDSLKGITIIDTPGFNDPISSRGETTKKALSQCHILLFVHNEDGYDATDAQMLNDQVAYAGIAELVDIFNRIDMIGTPEEWPAQLRHYLKQRADIKASNDIVKNLLANSKAIYVSALMALYGMIPWEHMDDDTKDDFGKFEEDFEELCQFTNRQEQQKAFVAYSNIQAVIDEINRLAKDKTQYLIAGPLLTLKGKLMSVIETITDEIRQKQSEAAEFNVSIEANKENLKKFENFRNSVLDSVKTSNLKLHLAELVQRGVRDIQKTRDSESQEEFTDAHYPESGLFTSGVKKGNLTRYNSFIIAFSSRMRDKLYDLKDSAKNVCKKEINSLINSISGGARITKEHQDNLNASLIAELLKEIEDFDIIVDPKTIEYIPSGSAAPHSRLKQRFLEDYSDTNISASGSIISSFKQKVDSLDYQNIATRKLRELLNRIEDALNEDPQQKERKVKEIENTINALEDEKRSLEEKLNAISKLQSAIGQQN